MLRLEDLTHAAGADFFEYQVLAEDEQVAFAGQQLPGLKLGELSLFDQQAGKRGGVARTLAVGDGGPNALHFVGRKQAGLDERLDELFDR